jgi:RNA polymerase sigma factor (TIGR02999 family)
VGKSEKPVTRLLVEWQEGRREAFDELLPHVYGELRRIAGHYMSDERSGHTLQATALVHEAYGRLVDADLDDVSRSRFLAVAARAMRNILVDHARGRGRVKRGGGRVAVTLDDACMVSAEPSADLIDLDEALSRLAVNDPRKAQVVELHYFGGMTYDEIAEALSISNATARLDMRIARAWLRSELEADDL